MKACPKGWHLPSREEYGKLDKTVAVGGVPKSDLFSVRCVKN